MISLKTYKIKTRIYKYASVNSALKKKKMTIILRIAAAKGDLNVKFDLFSD